MTTPSAPGSDGSDLPRGAGPAAVRIGQARGVLYWYQSTRLARASASCRYRMGNLVELLCGATSIVDARPPARAFRGSKVVVVVRPFLDRNSAAALAALRRRGVRLVADFDDLLFSGDPAEYPLVLSGVLSRAECAARMLRHREALDTFDAFTVSTEPLAERVAAAAPGKPVTVVPNGVSPWWVEQGRALYPPWRPGMPKVIRFLPGSPSHDADFATIVEPLGAFLRDHPEVALEIVGPLQLAPSSLSGCRVTHVRRTPFLELPRWLAQSWVTLAPLLDTPFNRCKSAIKFLESAAFGTPCIASPNPDTERHAAGGVVLAPGAGDWRNALELLLDERRRQALSQAGRAYVDERGTAEHGVRAFAGWVRPWLRSEQSS